MVNRTRKPPTRESQIERDLCALVKSRGGIPYKFKSPQRRSAPDRLCVMPGGVSFFVECKKPGERSTVLQIQEHRRLISLGQRVYVTDSYDKNMRIMLAEAPPR